VGVAVGQASQYGGRSARGLMGSSARLLPCRDFGDQDCQGEHERE
jgi:hypothetical protein